MVDKNDRLYVTCAGAYCSYPYTQGATTAYVAYIYSPGTYGWTKTLNFDAIYMQADLANGKTHLLDKNGWHELLDYDYIREKTNTAICTTSFSITSTTRITFTGADVTTAMKVGDYCYYWDAKMQQCRMSVVTVINSGTSFTVADAIFEAVATDPGLVSIGKVFFAKSSPMFGQDGATLHGNSFTALITVPVVATSFDRASFRWNKYFQYPSLLSAIMMDADKLCNWQEIASNWWLTPYFDGVVSGSMGIESEFLGVVGKGYSGKR